MEDGGERRVGKWRRRVRGIRLLQNHSIFFTNLHPTLFLTLFFKNALLKKNSS